MDINVCKKKHLTNMRAASSDETLRLIPHKVMGLEEALQWIGMTSWSK
jgi:GTP-binding protein